MSVCVIRNCENPIHNIPKSRCIAHCLNKVCFDTHCSIQPCFNFIGELKGLCCGAHKTPGMVNVKRVKCSHPGCPARPYYKHLGHNDLYCPRHKSDGMIMVRGKYRPFIAGMEIRQNRKCRHDSCEKWAHFNYNGEKIRLYCGDHKLSGMINVKSKQCQYYLCEKYPCYNYEGETSGTYCNNHKSPGMIDVTNKRCEHPGCATHSSYNYDGLKKPMYCFKHKSSTMVNVRDNKCQHINCTKIASFNYEGLAKRLYCKDHRLATMINVKRKSKVSRAPLPKTSLRYILN